MALAKKIEMEREKVLRKPPLILDYLLGGISAGLAVIVSNPFEVIKTRLQLQGELKKAKDFQKTYNGVYDAFKKITRTEGILAIQKGFTTAFLYQLVMNGTRLGSYSVVSSVLNPHSHEPHSSSATVTFLKNMAAGALSGIAGAAVGSPLYLVKTRMQCNTGSGGAGAVGYQHNYTSTWHALSSVYREGGVRALFQGVEAAALRVSSGSAVQLSTYAQFKQVVMGQTQWGDGLSTHLLSSLLCSFAVVACMNPFDVVATRLYNQPMKNGRGVLYTSVGDCFAKIIRSEGAGGFYKGSVAHYTRLGPHTIMTLVLWEQLRVVLRQYYDVQHI